MTLAFAPQLGGRQAPEFGIQQFDELRLCSVIARVKNLQQTGDFPSLGAYKRALAYRGRIAFVKAEGHQAPLMHTEKNRFQDLRGHAPEYPFPVAVKDVGDACH
jgi:hypothetical protein